MMNAATVVLNERNIYKDFDLEKDVLYFKIGVQGLVSFHGPYYNRKIRMTADEIRQLTEKINYFQISSNCYINISGIRSIENGTVCFGTASSDTKRLSVNRRKQFVIEQLFSQRKKNNEVKNSK
ncbi:hypothetical protein M6D81_30050 [Paenibacillus sp. J5C_2022]|uniref:hypothetical protein n=1 Tax=Paenibacillus sp. J5C2022 TaxID=2977129 RepID=UPI0021CEBC3C|nr:hypothetical protein [Paenibacillus sp. J5C2022]MCU6712952.1 hypothetical protein [Paenibacillus sp. J5C2022]